MFYFKIGTMSERERERNKTKKKNEKTDVVK